jgi:hypothetical protein
MCVPRHFGRVENGPDPSVDFLRPLVAEIPESAPWRVRFHHWLELPDGLQGRRSHELLERPARDPQAVNAPGTSDEWRSIRGVTA